MPQATTYEKSCGIIVFREQKVLLLHYPSGHWDFSKGHVDTGESEKETALRELNEETGISDVEFIESFRHTSQYQYRRNGVNYHKTVVYFLAKSRTTSVELSSEHQDFAWIPVEKCLEQLTFENSKDIFRKAHDIIIEN